MQETAYLRPAEAAQFIGVGVSTLWRYLANHEKTGFPQAVKISERVTLFSRSDLESWVESHRAQGGAA